MTLEITQILTTYAEFELFIDEHPDQHFELIDGAIVEKPMPSFEDGLIVMLLIGELYLWQKRGGVGMGGPEIRVRMPHDLHNARQPDIALFTQQIRLIPQHGAVPRIPDLAVEVQSPSDRIPRLRAKALYYINNGARLVWVVLPERRIIEVHYEEEILFLTEKDTLEGYDVLPGFTLPVAEVFAVLKAEGNDQ